MRGSRFVLGVVFSCLACGAPATPDAGSPTDAGPIIEADGGARVDAGVADAGSDDAGAADAGAPEADAGLDAGMSDAGGFDAGSVDAGLLDAGAFDAGLPDAGVDGGVDAGRVDAGLPWPDGGIRVRLMAANLTSGNLQNYDNGEGLRILQTLQADVIGIQEFNFGDSSDASITGFVTSIFDAGAWWVRGAGRIPNGVISRYPIIDGGDWDDTRATDREFTWALVDLPGSTDLWVVSVHLLSGAGPTARLGEAQQLVQLFSANVPPNTHLALIGDFNTDNRTENCLGALDASVVVAGPRWPTDGTLSDGGNGNTSTNRGKPYDWVAVSPSLHDLETALPLAGQWFPSGLVFDTRVFTPLPPPAQVGDSMSTNMQHMGVARDFVIVP